jgi:hypothetical protein
MVMSKRTETAIEVLKSGGYFRYALERSYQGGEKFKMRLRAANGAVVKGVGYQTKTELETRLTRRACAPSSTWPQEWALAEGVAA